jgi:chaperonin GroEL (HSP60 family)
MNDVTKQFEQFAEIMKAAMPQVKPNKNGYEIRTKVLEFAQAQAWQDYHAKWAGYELAVTKDGNEVVTEVKIPEAPGAEAVLETAQKFYEFVSGDKTTKTK